LTDETIDSPPKDHPACLSEEYPFYPAEIKAALHAHVPNYAAYGEDTPARPKNFTVAEFAFCMSLPEDVTAWLNGFHAGMHYELRKQLEEAKAQLEKAKEAKEAKAQQEEAKAQREKAKAQLEKAKAHNRYLDKIEQLKKAYLKWIEALPVDLQAVMKDESFYGWLRAQRQSYEQGLRTKH
jgi:hypothetical protein